MTAALLTALTVAIVFFLVRLNKSEHNAIASMSDEELREEIELCGAFGNDRGPYERELRRRGAIGEQHAASHDRRQ